MKERKDCKIIQDLLPNYIEGLTNEETDNYIKEHLDGCEQCRKYLDNMQKELVTNKSQIDDREVKIFKKYNKKLNILKVIVFAIIIIFVVRTGRNMIIIGDRISKLNQYSKSTNYHIIQTVYDGKSIYTTETYCKDNKKVTFIKRFTEESSVKFSIYTDGETTNFYREIDGAKEVELNSDAVMFEAMLPVTKYLSIKDFILSSITSNIKSTYCNGKECYFVTNDSGNPTITVDSGYYFDKETGLVIRNTEATSAFNDGKQVDNIMDFEYEFNQVDDEIFIEPNE